MRVNMSDKRQYSRTVMLEARHCAISLHKKCESGRTIEYIYDVVSVRMKKRSELTAEQAGSVDPDNQNDYWLFELGSSHSLSAPLQVPSGRRFRFRLTGVPDLFTAQNWSDLPDRYVSFIERIDAAL